MIKNLKVMQEEFKGHITYQEMRTNIDNLSKKLDVYIKEDDINFKKSQASEIKDDFLRGKHLLKI